MAFIVNSVTFSRNYSPPCTNFTNFPFFFPREKECKEIRKKSSSTSNDMKVGCVRINNTGLSNLSQPVSMGVAALPSYKFQGTSVNHTIFIVTVTKVTIRLKCRNAS